MPVVSIILPTCDRPDLWPRALRSVLRQTWQDWEVVLVDSNRRTMRLRDSVAWIEFAAEPRVRLVDTPHTPSAAAARNVGLAVARAEWVTYLDDDDVYLPDKVEAQLALARATGAPLVLCGYTVVLPKRRRTRQVEAAAFCDDERLTDANWGTPMLFHRLEPRVCFDETLRAGEDEVFAHTLIALHRVARVPNCARSLVEVFPQLGADRVHRGEAVWHAYRATWRITHRLYSRRARRAYLAMGRLVRAQNQHGGVMHFLRCVRAVLATRGPGAWRLVVNATAHRFGLFSNWMVS